jgi:hypothetical protein
LPKKARRVMGTIRLFSIITLTVFFSARTMVRNLDWQSRESLFQ